MPDAPAPVVVINIPGPTGAAPDRAAAPVPAPVAAPVAAPAPAAKAQKPSEEDDGNEEEDAPGRSGTSVAAIVLGILCVMLLIAVGVFWRQSADRARTIAANHNHVEQMEANTIVMQVQSEATKADMERLQTHFKEAKAENEQLKATVDKAKADFLVVQTQLDRTRGSSAAFQTQLAEAKVATLQQQGFAEVAKTQASVMETQLAKSRADASQLQGQLAEARARADAVQDKLARAEEEISQLKKLAAKK